MKTAEAFWMFLPEGLEDLFELVKMEKRPDAYELWLDEKKERSEEDRKNKDIVARGFTDYHRIQDFPMRGRPVYLYMRKQRWQDKATGETFSYSLDLPETEGTRLSSEFVAFLKDEG